MKPSILLILIVNLICLANPVAARTLAFPGAEGFGKHASGGRGGAVWIVTNLNDAGPGSLREAIEAEGPRTIVFAVSGTIYLEDELEIRHGDLTIAGQSAPGDGITLARRGLQVTQAENVIIRYIRSRLGDLHPRENHLQHYQQDAFTCMFSTRVIVDHCSFSWSIDETATAYNNRDFTMQWCLISESLDDSFHEKGPHGYGGIWGGKNATFHHNLFAHHRSRNPRFNGARYRDHATWGDDLVEFRNNVLYNWWDNSAYGGEPGADGFRPRYNMVNNVYKPGPATASDTADRIFEAYANPAGRYSRFHLSGNRMVGSPETTLDNWQGLDGVPGAAFAKSRSDEPFIKNPDGLESASNAYDRVLAGVGAVRPARDSVDRRILQEVATGTATFGRNGIIDSQDEVGGYPELKSLPAPADTDRDGMPDDWEQAHGLNPKNPEDRNADPDGNGYTCLEEYLNSLASSRPAS